MSLTPAMRAQLQSVDDVDGLLLLAILDDPVLSAPVHVVNDTRDCKVGDVTYVAIPMAITLPTDVSGQASQAQLEITNVGRELTAELEALPLGSSLDVTLQIVSRANPQQIEWEYEAAIGRVTATVPRVVIVLGDDTLLRQSAVLLRFDPTTAPGLFAG